MRFPWILTLALAVVTAAASAQRTKPVKPSHEEKAKSGPALKAPTQRNSSSAELQKIEQQTAKSAAGQKGSGRPHGVALKTQRQRANPPINFGSGTGAHGSGSGGAANSSKSRVRTKGGHH